MTTGPEGSEGREGRRREENRSESRSESSRAESRGATLKTVGQKSVLLLSANRNEDGTSLEGIVWPEGSHAVASIEGSGVAGPEAPCRTVSPKTRQIAGTARREARVAKKGVTTIDLDAINATAKPAPIRKGRARRHVFAEAVAKIQSRSRVELARPILERFHLGRSALFRLVGTRPIPGRGASLFDLVLVFVPF